MTGPEVLASQLCLLGRSGLSSSGAPMWSVLWGRTAPRDGASPRLVHNLARPTHRAV